MEKIQHVSSVSCLFQSTQCPSVQITPLQIIQFYSFYKWITYIYIIFFHLMMETVIESTFWLRWEGLLHNDQSFIWCNALLFFENMSINVIAGSHGGSVCSFQRNIFTVSQRVFTAALQTLTSIFCCLG